MSLDILDAISRLAPILTGMSTSAGKAQDTNAVINNNAAADRPTLVARNLSNSRLASLMSGYTKPTFKWGGPGAVAHGGPMPSFEGGFGPDSPETSALYKQVEKDALAQAGNNYGLKDPSASSAGSDLLGGASTVTSILGALRGLTKGGPSSGSGGNSMPSGPGSPGTFGQGSLPSGGGSGPSNVNTPFGIANQGGPSDVNAIGDQAIEMLRRLGLGIGGSQTEPMTGNPYI